MDLVFNSSPIYKYVQWVFLWTALWGHGILETPHFQQCDLEALCTQGGVVKGGAAAGPAMIQLGVDVESVAITSPWSDTRIHQLKCFYCKQLRALFYIYILYVSFSNLILYLQVPVDQFIHHIFTRIICSSTFNSLSSSLKVHVVLLPIINMVEK